MRELITENDKALIWKVSFETSHFFEVWIKIIGNHGKFKGQILNPADEDFGVWAWSCYTLESATKCFNEISEGTRQITPMIEA